MSKILDVLHKGTVISCIGMTVYGTGFLVTRVRDIQRKSKELDEYAKDEKLTYAEAAARVKPKARFLGTDSHCFPPKRPHTLVTCGWSDRDLKPRTEPLLGRMPSQEIKCCEGPHTASPPSALICDQSQVVR